MSALQANFFVAILLLSGQFHCLAAAPDGCTNPAPAILRGKWQFKNLNSRLQMNGSWTEGGAANVLNADYNLADLASPNGSFVTVDCSGFFSGEMHEKVSGQNVMQTTASGVSATVTSVLTGERNCTVTG